MGHRVDSSQLWSQEYAAKGIPSSFRDGPSGSVEAFFDYLVEKGVETGTAIDLGCGTGRNSIFLATKGFVVHSIDFVEEMISRFRNDLSRTKLSDRITPHCQSVTSPWPVPDRSVDIAIDTFCYKHQIAETDRRAYRDQLTRTMKPGGLFLLTLAGTDDGYYGPLLSSSPNPGGRVIVDPANGIPSVLFTRKDVEDEFRSCISFEFYEHKSKHGLMHGTEYLRSTHLFIGRRI
jgi:SAM-dependent methyltransferase